MLDSSVKHAGASTVLDTISDEYGLNWGNAEMLLLACTYIDYQMDPVVFFDFIKECAENEKSNEHDDAPASCECDNTHQANDTVCRWCYAHGRRHWSDKAEEDAADA